MRRVSILLWSLALAYVWQFFWLLGDSKGPHEAGDAWKDLAVEVLNGRQSGNPPMRVYYAKENRGLCNFLNFEAIWGNCVVVKIDIDVKDYRPESSSIVEREVEILGDKLRKPCILLSKLAPKNEVKFRESIGCGGWRKKFKLYISTHDITVAVEKNTTDHSNNWFPTTRTNLNTYHFEGEF